MCIRDSRPSEKRVPIPRDNRFTSLCEYVPVLDTKFPYLGTRIPIPRKRGSHPSVKRDFPSEKPARTRRRVFQRRALYRPKIKHDKTEQGPDLGLFLEVYFLENLAVIEGPKPEGKKPLKTVTTVTTLS